jgi:hypothetical protein
MSYLILVETPLSMKPLSWWKVIKRKLFKKDYDTVYFSVEIDREIYVYKSTLFGYVKAIELKNWKQSKYKSKIIPMNVGKNHL